MKKKKHDMKEKKQEDMELEQEVKTEAEETAQETEAADPKDGRIAELEEELKSVKAQLEKEKNDYLRLSADLENVRRRSAEERINLISSASEDTIKGLLPVLDDLERAMEILSKSSDEPAKEGTQLIYDKLMKYLKSRGLEVIDAKGKKFDTDFHEAVAQFPVPEEEKKGFVFDVTQTGYTLGGKILRYAKVVVGI